MAYHVVGGLQVTACLEHLGLRECRLGGYRLQRVTFNEPTTSRLTALVFIASPCNHLYLGPAAVDKLARQVTSPVPSRLDLCDAIGSTGRQPISRCSVAGILGGPTGGSRRLGEDEMWGEGRSTFPSGGRGLEGG